MMLRSVLLAVLALAGAAPVSAGAPTDEQMQQLQRAFGFDNVLRRLMEGQIDEPAAFAELQAEQRSCMKEKMASMMDGKFTEAFKQLFGDRDVVRAWLEFADTAGGRKFMSFVRAGVTAKMNGEAGPAPEMALADMDPHEMADTAGFMATPAAQVLQQPFPDVMLSDTELETFTFDAMQRCGIEDTGA